MLAGGTVAYYGPRWHSPLLIILGLFWAWLVWMLVHGGGWPGWFEFGPIVLFASLSLACVSIGVMRLIVNPPTLVITPREVFMPSLFGRPKRGVPLEQISAVEIAVGRGGHACMGVLLRADSDLASEKYWKRIQASHKRAVRMPAAVCVNERFLRSHLLVVAGDLADRCGCKIVMP